MTRSFRPLRRLLRARLRRVPILILAACAGLHAAPARSRQVRITLLHTSDVQGHVEALRFREWDHYHGGLLRCASLVDRIRGQEPNVLLLDAGGMVRGSPESYLSAGLLPLKTAACMAYDARVPSPGRSEPGGLSPEFAAYLPYVPALAADAPSRGGDSHRTFNLDGVMVTVVGLRSDAAEAPDVSLGRFDEVMKAVRAERPHLVVLLAHLSHDPRGDIAPSLLHRVMQRYQDLDVVLGGNSARVTRSARVGDVLYTEAGPHARWLGRVDLVYDTVRSERVSAEADVLEVGPDIPVHDPLRRALGSSLGRIERALDREIGRAERRLRATSPTPGQSDLQELVARAVAGDLRADIVLVGTTGLGGLAEGPIRWRDVIRAVPDPRVFAVISIPAVELRGLLGENMGHLAETSFLGIHGARYEWVEDETGPGEVRNLVLSDGTSPHGRRRLRVAFDLAVLSAPEREVLHEIAHRPGSRLEEHPMDLRSLVAAYLEEHGVGDLRRETGFTK